jgi:stage IV sporulation protein FB
MNRYPPRNRDDDYDLDEPGSGGRWGSAGGRGGAGGGGGAGMLDGVRRWFARNDNPMNWAVPLGRVAGIRVRVHVLYVIFMGVTLATSGSVDALRWQALTLGALFVLVLLHEFGHCFACRWVGGTADDILMWPLGGLASCRPPHTWRASLITTLGGPGVNVVLLPVLGGALWLVSGSLEAVLFNPFMGGAAASAAFNGGGWAGLALWAFHFSNLALLAFNMLLPMFPMDAGRVVQEVLWSRIGYRASMGIATTLGLFLAVGVGMVALLSGQSTLLAVCVFAGLTCYQERLRLRFMGAGSPGTLAGVEADDEPWRASLERDATDGAKSREKAAAAAERARGEEEKRQVELDRILDKIKRSGMAALTSAEKKFLEQDTSRRRSTG